MSRMGLIFPVVISILFSASVDARVELKADVDNFNYYKVEDAPDGNGVILVPLDNIVFSVSLLKENIDNILVINSIKADMDVILTHYTFYRLFSRADFQEFLYKIDVAYEIHANGNIYGYRYQYISYSIFSRKKNPMEKSINGLAANIVYRYMCEILGCEASLENTRVSAMPVIYRNNIVSSAQEIKPLLIAAAYLSDMAIGNKLISEIADCPLEYEDCNDACSIKIDKIGLILIPSVTDENILSEEIRIYVEISYPGGLTVNYYPINTDKYDINYHEFCGQFQRIIENNVECPFPEVLP